MCRLDRPPPPVGDIALAFSLIIIATDSHRIERLGVLVEMEKKQWTAVDWRWSGGCGIMGLMADVRRTGRVHKKTRTAYIQSQKRSKRDRLLQNIGL